MFVRPAKQRLRDTVLLYGQGMDPQTCLNPISDSQKEVLEDGYLDAWGEITLVVAQEEEKEDAESEDL
uniref:Uncharacterized protein n=1 Tax=Psilocybe cubensis TaxID=181762 RepID=A0A8H7XPT6_PSICU